MTRLVQLRRGTERRVALVDEPHLRFLQGVESVYALAGAAIAARRSASDLARERATGDGLEYDSIYHGRSEWRLLTPIDHPDEPARCLVSGTGLTHMGSARERNSMHEVKETELTDSMKMFRWGLEGGQPAEGKIGNAPEWFYKGTGTILRAHGESLVVPAYAEDGGEEGEVASVYVVAPDGSPRRIGFVIGNEFSDHRFEKKNYLNLAGSKIRTCSIGPELVLASEFQSVPGKVSIERGKEILWSKEILTGEAEMCHSMRNIEHHHFKFETHRRPGDVHVHYLGACSLSFGAGIELRDGDVMEIRFEGFGRPLRNPLRRKPEPNNAVKVEILG